MSLITYKVLDRRNEQNLVVTVIVNDFKIDLCYIDQNGKKLNCITKSLILMLSNNLSGTLILKLVFWYCI